MKTKWNKFLIGVWDKWNIYKNNPSDDHLIDLLNIVIMTDNSTELLDEICSKNLDHVNFILANDELLKKLSPIASLLVGLTVKEKAV